MAAKKPKAKSAAKPAAPKRKASAKAKANPKAKGKAKAKASTKAKAQAKGAKKTSRAAKPKQKATPAKQRSTKPAPAAAEAQPVETGVIDTAAAEAGDTASEAKKGPLARFAGSVGNLFARVTGKKPAEPEEPRSPDATIELASDDIEALTAAPPPTPKSKP